MAHLKIPFTQYSLEKSFPLFEATEQADTVDEKSVSVTDKVQNLISDVARTSFVSDEVPSGSVRLGSCLDGV